MPNYDIEVFVTVTYRKTVRVKDDDVELAKDRAKKEAHVSIFGTEMNPRSKAQLDMGWQWDQVDEITTGDIEKIR